MKKHAKEFNIVKMAGIFDVTPSGYYSYSNRELSQHSIDDANLLEDIKIFSMQTRKFMDATEYIWS